MTERIEFVGVTGAQKPTLLRSTTGSCVEAGFSPLYEDLTSIAKERREWRRLPAQKTFFIQGVYYLHRYTQISRSASTGHNRIISDFGLETDHGVYSKTFHQSGLLGREEFDALERLRGLVRLALPPLTGMIYRQCSPGEAMARCRQRGDVDVSLLNLLEKLIINCDALIHTAEVPVLILDGPVSPLLIREFLAERGLSNREH